MKPLFYLTASLLLLIGLVCADEVPSKLLKVTLKQSDDCKTTASQNANIEFHYKARIWDSQEPFESTYGGEPAQYKLGRDQIIKGLETGVQGMCPGEVRRLVIPSELAFGDAGLPGKVPGNTAVIYDVEMIRVKKPLLNAWFYTGLVVIAGAYWYFDRMAKAVDAKKAARYQEMQKKKAATEDASLDKAPASS